RERERRRRVAGLIRARAARGDVGAIGSAVKQRRTAHGPGGGVAAAPVDRDLVVVPAVYIGWAGGPRRAGSRGRGGVLEWEGGRGRIARLVGAGCGHCCVGAVGGAVGGGAGAACDAGGCVAPVPVDGDRGLVPAVRVRAPVGTGSEHRRAGVVLEREGGRRRVARLVGACHARGGAGTVGAAIGVGA